MFLAYTIRAAVIEFCPQLLLFLRLPHIKACNIRSATQLPSPTFDRPVRYSETSEFFWLTTVPDGTAAQSKCDGVACQANAGDALRHSRNAKGLYTKTETDTQSVAAKYTPISAPTYITCQTLWRDPAAALIRQITSY